MKRALMALLFLATPALAHDWYPIVCCSGQDCEPLPVEAITETATGWQIAYCSAARPVCVNGFVAHGKERHSEDGRFHLCFTSERIICFFVPSVT